MSTTNTTQPCGDCGMPCAPGEYHPYAACLMFKACHNSDTVRGNLQAVLDDGGASQRTEQQAAAEPVTEFEKTFPDHIWLDAGEAMEFAEPGDTFRDLHEVTWSEDNATGFGVKYVRADLANPPAASDPIDIEQMLRDCVPGGSSVDPQHVCDNIRAWFSRVGAAKSEGEAK